MNFIHPGFRQIIRELQCLQTQEVHVTHPPGTFLEVINATGCFASIRQTRIKGILIRIFLCPTVVNVRVEVTATTTAIKRINTATVQYTFGSRYALKHHAHRQVFPAYCKSETIDSCRHISTRNVSLVVRINLTVIVQVLVFDISGFHCSKL